MKSIKLGDIPINKTNVLVTWDGNDMLTRNMDSIINDFEFMNQNVGWDMPDDADYKSMGLDTTKELLLNAFICGVYSATNPQSMFNTEHTVSEEAKAEIEESETEDFSKSLEI